MNKKVKKFFKRNRSQSEHISGVDICSVNIVNEAEKIIEEYVSKMGYRFCDKKSNKRPRIIIVASVLLSAAAIIAAIKVLLI